MSSGAASPDCVSLAIAFRQAPGRFPDLLHGRAPLPEGVGLLLRLAGGGAPEVEGLDGAAFVSADEVRAAARFFIEQVLLSHEADHYRVLGVNPGASIEEIKEHHRLLMRLFHPDRERVPDERSYEFATRINLAYGALRQPGTQAAYDERLRRERQAAAQHAGMRPLPEVPEGPRFRLNPAVARRLPALVLSGFALLASLGVGLVYLNRVPEAAIGAGNAGYARTLPRETLSAPLPRETPSAPLRHENALVERFKAEVAAPAPKPAPPLAEAPPAVPATGLRASEALALAPPSSAPSPPPAVAPSARAPVAAPEPRQPAEALPVAVRVRDAAGPAEPPRPAPKAREDAARRDAAPVARPAPPSAPAPLKEGIVLAAVQPAAAAAPARPEIALDALAELVARLSALYEQGDLEGFLALFAEDARSELGGKGRIRSDYENLFRISEARRLYIYDMVWAREGETLRGEGHFQAQVQHRGEDSVRVYNGTIRLEVRRRNEATQIRGIYHKTTG